MITLKSAWLAGIFTLAMLGGWGSNYGAVSRAEATDLSTTSGGQPVKLPCVGENQPTPYLREPMLEAKFQGKALYKSAALPS